MQKRYGIPYAVWALGSDIWGLGRIPLLREYLRVVLNGAHYCYADGLQLGADVEKLSGKSCSFLPSTRELPRVPNSSVAERPPYRLAFLGRWHPNKGVDIFLESLLKLSPDDWAHISEVRVHGGGPLEAQVHELVDRLKVCGRPVAVGGYLDATAAAELIAWCDYLVLPSRLESIPVVFSDAAQSGRPLVATPVGDLPRLFQQYEFGILAAEPSVAAFAEALQKALRTRPSKFQTDLAAVAGQFDLEAIAGQFASTVSREME
jgi:glycosyltransferase involved in cell wall biosynthesis